MPEHSAETKAKLGRFLLKVHRQEFGYTLEEWELGKVLEGRGLMTLLGLPPGPKVLPITELVKQAQLAAITHFVLTGLGKDFVLRHSEANLSTGHFLLPGETAWYDNWPWKILWPALISLFTSVVTAAITTYIMGIKK